MSSDLTESSIDMFNTIILSPLCSPPSPQITPVPDVGKYVSNYNIFFALVYPHIKSMFKVTHIWKGVKETLSSVAGINFQGMSSSDVECVMNLANTMKMWNEMS